MRRAERRCRAHALPDDDKIRVKVEVDLASLLTEPRAWAGEP